MWKSRTTARFAPRRAAPRFRRNGLRTSTRKVEAPRWQVGNFKLETDVGVVGDSAPDSVNVVVPLAQIPLLTPESTNGERFNQRMIKAVDIGGLVWDAYMLPNWGTDLAADFTGTVDLWGQQLLVTDRLSPDGSPTAAVEAPWDLTTQPTTSVALTNTGDDDYPLRIHDRWSEYYRFEIDARAQANITVVRPEDTRVVTGRRSRSKRLKLRIDGTHTLAFTFVTTKGNNFPVTEIERSIKHCVIGTIYYRYVF